MASGITIRSLQEYIKEHDFRPHARQDYFLKLVEEMGELADALRRDERMHEKNGDIKNTVEEELYDVLYYVAGLANVYDIDLEQCLLHKEELNRARYDKQAFFGGASG